MIRECCEKNKNTIGLALQEHKQVFMEHDRLQDYVRNKATPGDILKSFYNDGVKIHELLYYCTPNNIGKDANPYWVIVKHLMRKLSMKKKIDYILQMIQLYSYLLPTVKIGNAIMDFRERYTLCTVKK